MHKYQRACCFRPSTVPHIATVAFLAGLGHALMLLPCDSNGEIYVADGRAVLHSSVLLQCVMDIYQEGGTADSYSTVRLDVATEELLTLAQFMNDVDDIVDACQWVTQNIPEHTEAEQIRRLLSAANRLDIHLFIITVGISLPLPGTQMRVLPPLEFFRERLALPTLNTVGPAITDPDFDR
ncbi:unnamed protein product (mitochondrion) [Plasmodiophora brassicae]|uniref:Uncharacterized protein n=1 Tax=Plasmodiophora brassicae TaxID=37360 RepID=A0A3P3YHW4_PLABS|nr:unnamed protein product [Plasmodiophora brassicae]